MTLVAILAYWNSFAGGYVYDDGGSILRNPTIRQLWPLSVPLSPNFADGSTADGRPILNLTLAINYAVSGTEIWSYHAVNLLLHVLCGWVLFGILRRALQSAAVPANLREAAIPLACAVTVLWIVHPLQTESVTYIVQRAESLSVLFYLLTLYTFIRGAETSKATWPWFAASVAACFLGVASKETLVTAPFMVLLYDRTFLAGTSRAALRKRWPWYLALVASWVPLAWLMFHTGSRGGTAGFGTSMPAATYAFTQCEAVVRYLRQCFWPANQVFDYGRYHVTDPWQVWPQALLLSGLGVATLYSLWRKPALGFALCAIFVVLAPTSSVVPIPNQTMAEHRMYLPLAGVITLSVVGLYSLLCRQSYFVFAIAAVALAAVTIHRNQVYRSELGIWQDTVAKWPWSARGQINLGRCLAKEGKVRDVIPHFLAAAEIEPDFPGIHTDTANLYLQLNDLHGAKDALQKAVSQTPQNAIAHANLANVLIQLGLRNEARTHAEQAMALDPSNAQANSTLGILTVSEGSPSNALPYFRRAVEFDSASAEYRNNLGMTLARLGQRTEALLQFREALRLDPTYQQARANLNRYEGSPQDSPAGGAK